MTPKLFVSAIAKLLLGVVLVGVLVFLPAGTLSFFGGWLFMACLFLPMFLGGIVMMLKDPALLKSRLDAKEKMGDQKQVVRLSGLMFIVGFVLAGLDFRFSWLPLPRAVNYVAAGLMLIAYLFYAEVLRENRFLSRTIKVVENQTVVDTGLYGIVRHPMYSATLLLFTVMPLVLGSLIALPVFLLYPAIIAKRIKGEEQLLQQELPGYDEYMTRVRWRLIPYIW